MERRSSGGLGIDDLELVVAVGETGSLTAAALRLHVAQPALSRRLANLERRLGGPLFERGRHGAIATPAGRAVIDGAVDVLDAVDRLERSTRAVLTGSAGRLRVGTTPTLGADVLPATLGPYRSLHPDVEVDLVSSGDSAGLCASVADGRNDLALVVLPAEVDPRLAVPIRRRQQIVVALPLDHPLVALDAIRSTDLLDQPLVVLRPGEGLRILVDELWVAAGGTPRVAIETADREMMLPMVAAGLGLTLIPERFARQRGVGSVALRPLDPPLEREVGAVVRAGSRSELVDHFVDHLVADWAEDRAG